MAAEPVPLIVVHYPPQNKKSGGWVYWDHHVCLSGFWPNSIFWTAQFFVTKLGMVVHLHESECYGFAVLKVKVTIRASVIRVGLLYLLSCENEAGTITNVQLQSWRPDSWTCTAEMPASAGSKTKCMANRSPATHQTLRQKAGTGEDGHIHLADWTFSVAVIEKKKTSFVTRLDTVAHHHDWARGSCKRLGCYLEG